MSPPITAERRPPVAPRGDSRRRCRTGGQARPRVGSLVRVTSGPAAGAHGRVCRCADGQATLLATVLPRRSLLLTVDAADCAALADTERD